MKYLKFTIENYRAIREKITIDLSPRIIPLVGVNECGKTTILQAIFCFDYINDEEYDGQHLQNIDNLYSTVSTGDCVVSAVIECTREDLVACVKNVMTEKKSNNINDSSLGVMQQFIDTKDKITSITMSRNISNERRYTCSLFEEYSDVENDLLCREIIQKMPYTLYNDDFNDRPTSKVSLTEDTDSGWLGIFERVFHSTNKEYSLKSIAKNDERRRKSIISEVESYLSNTLTDAWGKFSPTKNQIAISLEIRPEENNLLIYIKERPMGKSEKYFKVIDRSKGFIWYYNFIMKIRFNPKQAGYSKDTIFLLDEPGSYLHQTAQEELCKKLCDIAKNEGVVIYCTHSPQLLLPSIIPFNTIQIVEKRQGNNICLDSITTKNNLSSKRNTAMQPVFQALMIPEYQLISSDEMIICVEGIYDKYCIEIFCNIKDNVRILPGVSAESILENISYLIAYNKEYLALWDNDREGKKVLGKAKVKFGLEESKRFALLPDIKNRGKIRMEEMIASEDYHKLCKCLKLPDDTSYENIICSLYYSDTKIRKSAIRELGNETKCNFEALNTIINNHFQQCATAHE